MGMLSFLGRLSSKNELAHGKGKSFKKVLFISFFTGLYSAESLAVQGTDFPLPERYNRVDERHVNMVGVVPAPSVNTVSIGGERGLSHSITGYYTLHQYNQDHGYLDSFAGGLKYAGLWINQSPPIEYDQKSYSFFWAMRASAFGDSADFLVMRNGEYDNNGRNYTSNYYYEALGDKRHTLEIRGSYRVWTKPDGTEVYFDHVGGAGYDTPLRKIVYPNGFTIRVTHAGATTNTGYQIKLDHIDEQLPIDPDKTQQSGFTIPSMSSIQTNQWWIRNPKYIRGINRAVEYCQQSTTPCDLENEWPTATFNWPGGMPRAVFIGETVFSVVDSKGAESQFHYKAQDAALSDLEDPTSTIPGEQAGDHMIPRLVAFQGPNEESPSVFYTYENDIDIANNGTGGTPIIGEYGGKLIEASGVNGLSGYEKKPWGWGGENIGNVSAYNTISQWTYTPGAIDYHYHKSTTGNGLEATIKYEQSFRNFVWRETVNSGPDRYFAYNDGNNLWKVTLPQVNGQDVIWESGYPDSCINPGPQRNRKTCNKPRWVKDPKGNITSYTYHPESGQVASITYPPNNEGLVAQKRFKYLAHYAYYKNASGQKVQESTPVWLKSEESYCINSNYTGSQCDDNDEVVTKYEYDHDNLHLTGVAVVVGGVERRRTCYSYDIYGNKIGEIPPRAGSNSCAGGHY